MVHGSMCIFHVPWSRLVDLVVVRRIEATLRAWGQSGPEIERSCDKSSANTPPPITNGPDQHRDPALVFVVIIHLRVYVVQQALVELGHAGVVAVRGGPAGRGGHVRPGVLGEERAHRRDRGLEEGPPFLGQGELLFLFLSSCAFAFCCFLDSPPRFGLGFLLGVVFEFVVSTAFCLEQIPTLQLFLS